MKIATKSMLALTALLAALPLTQASAAETIPGWYAGLGAGMNFQENTGSETTGVPKFKFDNPNPAVFGDAGYAWSNGLRLEGEAFHSYSVVHRVDGSLSNTDLFANALYDIDLCPHLTPYVGAGIGIGFPDAENIGPTSGATHIDDSAAKLAYQGIVGFSVPLSREWEATADYRYIATLDPKFKDSAGGKDRLDNASHNILIGVRYNFDAPPPVAAKVTQAPRPMPHPVAKAAVAPVPQTFQVFFDFDKSELTSEAKRIITAAAQEYQTGKYVRIVVTGHTDTKGTTKYNKGLSDRRAAAVKAEFAKLGVDANVVTTLGAGKNGLLVPTNDQVREAQNRRAEIVLDKK